MPTTATQPTVSAGCLKTNNFRLNRRASVNNKCKFYNLQTNASLPSMYDYMDYMMGRLQSVLKSAARLVLKMPPRSSTSEAMVNILHWLPFPHRITYKLAVMTYKCLHGLAPPYLSGRFTSVSDVPGRSMLRSNTFDRQQLLLPRTKTATIGPRGFYYAGPHSWNSLPVVLRNNPMSMFTFRKNLKTALYRR